MERTDPLLGPSARTAKGNVLVTLLRPASCPPFNCFLCLTILKHPPPDRIRPLTNRAGCFLVRSLFITCTRLKRFSTLNVAISTRRNQPSRAVSALRDILSFRETFKRYTPSPLQCAGFRRARKQSISWSEKENRRLVFSWFSRTTCRSGSCAGG